MSEPEKPNIRIGALELGNPLVLAPLAGITNLAFRLLIKSMGCGLVCTEMVSANGLVRNQKKTLAMLASAPEEKPVSVQIFGADPDAMAGAAQMVSERGADVVDINFGCSVRKVVRTGAGVALMKDMDRAEKVIKAVRRATDRPFTIKMRTGHEPSGDQAMELARLAEDCGVDAVSVHPRTAAQMFTGFADWTLIRKIKEKVSIPVVGNGDVKTPADALKMMEETGCDCVMIGRAAFSNPWVFPQTLDLLSGRASKKVGLDMRKDLMLNYIDLSVEHMGEKRACFLLRSRLAWLVKGLPMASRFRESVKLVSTREEARQKVMDYFLTLQNRSRDGAGGGL